jgi:hypothetical protein
MPQPLEPPDDPPQVDAARHAGVYERLSVRIELTADDGMLSGRVTSTGTLAELDDESPVEEMEMVAVSDDVFVARADDTEETWTPVVFYQLADGSPYLHMGARATPKLGS